MIGISILQQYDYENGKRNLPNRNQKYMPYVSSFSLPILMLLIPVILLFFHPPKIALGRFFTLCFTIFLHIICYYALLLLLLPVIRRFVSARACALLWIIPNYLYITHHLYMVVEHPTFILRLPGKIIWIVLAIWFIGFASVLTWHIRSHLRYRSFVLRDAKPVTDLEVLELWRAEVYKTNIKHAYFELVVSPNVSTPITIGLFKRTMKVVLPDRIYSQDDLLLIYRHELIHICREDTLTKLFLIFCTAMCWFNPLMWVAKRKSSEDLELSCDETVLIYANDNTKNRYAELILKTAGDERGFTTCLSVKAKSLLYRLKCITNKKKCASGAFLVGFVFFLLALSCGHIALAYNDSTIEKTILISNSSDPFQFESLFDNREKHPLSTTNRVLCSDVEALMNYLEGLTISEMTGNYSLDKNDYNILVSLANSEKSCMLCFSDNFLEVTISSIEDFFDYDYYTYYLPDGTDWEFFDSIISDYPVLDVSVSAESVAEWFKFYPKLQTVWENNEEAKIFDTEVKTISGYKPPYSATFYFSEPVVSGFSIEIESLDGLKECTLYPSKAPHAAVLLPEDPAFYPAKFTVYATFDEYKAEYQFIIE